MKINLLYMAVAGCMTLLLSCQKEQIEAPAASEESEQSVIHIGGLITDELTAEVEQLTRAEAGDKTPAENLEWLQGALKSGLDITYSNLNNGAHVVENQKVAILTWTGNKLDNGKGEYTFLYKGTEKKALWYSNGSHYFEGVFVPDEIRQGNNHTIDANRNLTTDQSSSEDYTYDDSGHTTGQIGNYTLLNHYLGMPPNWSTAATVGHIMLPFKHRLARVLAYVLIDDELNTQLKGYDYNDTTDPVTPDNPTTTVFSFEYVKVLEQVNETAGTEGKADVLTPEWTLARKVIPHFVEEMGGSLDQKGALAYKGSNAGAKEDAEKYFIVYTRKADLQQFHPNDKEWSEIHEGWVANTNRSKYERKSFNKVPIYDIIVRPTYTTKSQVMYDEQGYYKADNTVNQDVVTHFLNEKNSINFELTLESGLSYSKKFEFDLDANFQTIVYLTVTREGVNCDSSESQLWVESKSVDTYYGVDNSEGHNLSQAGSSWQRAYRNSTLSGDQVTDGSFYNGTQYLTNNQWVAQFAKATADGDCHGDYFILDDNITIDARLLPVNFVFTGHLDARGHTITLTNMGETVTDKEAYDEPHYENATSENYNETLYVLEGDVYKSYSLPILYQKVHHDEVLYQEGDDIPEGKHVGDVKEEARDEYVQVSTQPTIVAFMNGSETYYIKIDENYEVYSKPTLYVSRPIHHGAVTHISPSYLFAGLNATYTTNQETASDPYAQGVVWQANVHKEKNKWVPVAGYRSELMNVYLLNATFFPKSAVFSGNELNKSEATVTGNIVNCWQKPSGESNYSPITNTVPIPDYN